jgi:hypothetical protein
VVIARNGSNVHRMPPERIGLVRLLDLPGPTGLSIMSYERSAGFYASLWGVLPYSFGPSRPESYAVIAMTDDWSPRLEDRAGSYRERAQP